MDLFDRIPSVAEVEVELELRGRLAVPWAEFVLNPRQLRGSDFLMRWSQGRWSEERLIEAVNETGTYLAIPYGPSGTAPDDSPREFELYFTRPEEAGLGEVKRPDLLVFSSADKAQVWGTVEAVGGVEQLPFTAEDELVDLLSRALLAVECENSLWVARQMPDYGSALRPMRRLGGQLGLPKNAVLPTIILKEEDWDALRDWQAQSTVPIHIWHVFYDLAFGIPFDEFEELIKERKIEPRAQTFQAPGGAVTRKVTYRCYYHYGYPLAAAREEPELVPDCIVDGNGHVLPYVRFQGGSMELSTRALALLDQVREQRGADPHG